MDFIRYMFGPQLYMEYGEATDEMYTIALIERIGDYILTALQLMWEISLYTSPISIALLYRRNYLMKNTLALWLKFSVIIGFIFLLAMFFRGLGRYQSDSYHGLMEALKMTRSKKRALQGRVILTTYDFDFRWWPVDFDVRRVNRNTNMESKVFKEKQTFDITLVHRYVLAYIMMHTMGIRLLYPGAIKLLQGYLRPSLVNGRAELIQEYNAKRFKVKTVDRNEIDTLFIDNRSKGRKGDVLLITCEGNLGYYEIGLMGEGVGREFSVLGWNHPGFAGSSGKPYPAQDFNAIDAVMQFAIQRLEFSVEDILLYGWSIGGFTALCGASKYGGIRGLILDATFDNILHLALPRMPAFLSGMVELSIRRHCNLNNEALIKQYNGPVFLIRRAYDETIAWNSRISANRGNFLLLALLQHRYPKIFQPSQLALMELLLSKPLSQTASKLPEAEYLEAMFIASVAAERYNFPMRIGENYSEQLRDEMAEYLLLRHCQDFRSTHCTLLPLEHFNAAWENISKSWEHQI